MGRSEAGHASAREHVAGALDGLRRSFGVVAVRTEREGYVAMVRARQLVSAAVDCDGLVVQRARIGEYATADTRLAAVSCTHAHNGERLARATRDAFVLARERAPLQDVAFPIRQLADIALKGLSPAINDPTTTENAMDALSSLLIRLAAAEQPSAMRADDRGVVRFVALTPDLDDLVRLGFEQVRVYAAPDPLSARRLLTLLERVEDAAQRGAVRCAEPARQAALIGEAPAAAAPAGGPLR